MAEENIQQLKMEDSTTNLAPFDPTKKKKKKKVVFQEQQTDHLDDDDDKENAGEENRQEGVPLGRNDHDRDYTYEELLDRVFRNLSENNPELAADRPKATLRPAQVLREGTKKTVFVNFIENCKSMRRLPDHVMSFMLAELGTSGSIDGKQRLVVKGLFSPRTFEGLLRRYVNEYVICNCCKSAQTILSRENRLCFLLCEKTGSRRTVAPIKAGFVAVVKREVSNSRKSR
ncbi:eukaryotic translation initiation factor 2 subunit beta-like [Rutidosis leptorrhynchoides]|uniref:eukaryotic translation initiation factor 2 subunit beta-like n=1 Tax=Rutidosis leptorrhynchoides TaxID=125765 RepID=UPI003A98F7D7